MRLSRHGDCCAVNTISGLSVHKEPEAAMRSFCKAVLTEWDWDFRNSVSTKTPRLVPNGTNVKAFYIFSGVEHIDRDWGGYTKKGYGGRFATFIRRHKLGKVTASILAPNRTGASGHHDRVWVWHPEIKPLIAWYLADKAKQPKAKERA